jgi:hypothetical protein
MAVPVYLEPEYITYEMIEKQVAKEVLVTNDPLDPEGIYLPLLKTFMAYGESYIIKTILSDYVQVPLETIDNQAFDTLYDNPKYRETYISIRDMFTTSALWQIYKNYFGTSGTTNGANLITQYSNKITIYTNNFGRLDQAVNPKVKNAFVGLKRAINGSQRIARQARTACGIPQGRDQAWAAFNAQQNLRWGFNK